MTHLAVAIMVESLQIALNMASVAAEQGADLVEYRIDRFTDDEADIQELIRRSPLPCIVTCRPNWEGGDYDGDDQKRLSILEHAGLAQPAYLDLELAAFERSANLRQKIKLVIDHADQGRPTPTGLILSSHDFTTRPADLMRKVNAMVHEPAARVVKFAFKARSLRDNIEAFEILRAGHKPTIALCMGPFGLPSRVLAGKFGALLTFAGLDDQTTTAPGQVGVRTMKSLYRWDHINPDTRVYGVIGHPVEHSMSPAIHNAGFDAVGHDGVYLPLPIMPEYEQFKATVGQWLEYAPLHFRGASVTLPHKENLLRFVKEMGGQIEELSQWIGAANTLVVREDGGLHACNTDYAAALDSVCAALGGGREKLSGLRVGIIGAGGVARAVAAGFARHGSTVVLYNRTLEKAGALADQMNAIAASGGKVVAADLAKLCKSCCQVYVNCTPIGMHPEVGQTPMPELPKLEPGTVVFDTIYNPARTRLLAEAQQAGAKTINGIEMFVLQAARQFELWTNQPAPIALFRNIMRQKLGE